MRKQRRQRKIEIFRLEDRVLFEAAGAAEAVEAVENASNPNPDRQNDISESERQEKEAQSVAKYAGPDGAAIQDPGAPVQDQGAGLTRPDAIQQDPAQKLVEGSGDFSDVPDVTQEHTSELSDFLNADFSVTTDSTLSFSDSLSSDSGTHELIVIDSDAAKDLDLDALSDKTEVLVLDNDSDAMEQINAYLDSHDGKYDSIRFVTDSDSDADSAPDHLELNGREVSASDLDAVRDHLADGGDLSVQTALDDAAPVYTLTPDGDFELAHADDLHDAVIHPEIDETITVDASANVPVSALSNPVEEGRKELVIINSNIADRDVVLSQLGGRDVLEIDPSQDALSQIQDYLDANPDTRYDAIHILTHGNDQGFYLGSTQVTDAGQMTVFTGHMAENADFMLYGCNLAATERGQALIHEIADVTGCDVAASTDMTGAAAVGGDWVLEYNVGVVETASISLNADWNYRLAAITVDGKGESDTTAVNLAEALTKAGPDGSITINAYTPGTEINTTVTIIANAETGNITISTTGVVLNGTGYTNVTINGNGGIENSNLTVTGTFTSSGSISGSTVNAAEKSIVINGGTVSNSSLNASGAGRIDVSGGGFTDTTVINSGTDDINIGSNSKFTDSSVTHSGTGNINISGGTFTESPVAHSGAGSTTITGGEFTGSEKTGTGISISGSGALKISGGTFSGFEKAVEFSSSGTATITGGGFNDNVYGLVNNGSMSVSDNVSFTSNHNASGDSAATAGAGILNNASGELSVSDVTIGAMGGGNYYGLENHGTITALKDSTIQYNMMSGLRNEGSIDSINNVTLKENGLSTDEEKTSYTALGGGLYNSGTIKKFIDIQITNNHAAQGGGIYNTGEISADVNDRSFNIYISGNEATQGGGIYWGGGFLDTSALVYQYGDPDSRGLTGNTAHQGGGVYIASGDVLFQDFRLFENTADHVNLEASTYAGGGLYIASGAKVILDSVTVENNVVENCSNGINPKYWQYYYNDPDLAIGDTGKTTDQGGRGGGIYSEGTLTVLHSQFNKNVVKFANSSQLPDYYAFLDTLSMGGAIYSSGTLTVYDSYIHNNTAKNGLGGGIYLGGGSATIASTEYYTGESLWQQTGSLNSMIITGNTANGSSDGTQYAAGGFGGGIYSDSSVNLTLDSVTLSGNIATLTVASSSGTSYDIGRGGGLYFGEADAYRTYSAVTSAPLLGNGVLTIDGTVRDLTNGSANVAELEMNRRTSLIFDNHAVSGSGLYINSASTVSIGNTEIYNNATTAYPYFTNTNDAQNFFQNFVVSSNQKDASVDIKVTAQDISAAGKLFTSSGIGLYLGGSGATASLDGVSIYGHDVDNAFGGGIYVTGNMYGSGLVHLNLVNTTLYDNTAAYGGGVYIGENASVNILNTTVAGNTAATAGGGVYIIGSNSAVNILNSILVGNTGGDLAAESDAPAMNDMYSLFGSVLVKNSLTLQYEQQSVDPTSCINVKAEDIFADPTLANNWQIQGAQYSKAFDSAGKVYYYDYAYGTTHTLAISAEGAAAYKGVYTAIDLATSVMYFNTLNSQAVAAGQTSGTWMNFSTRTAATVSSDKIVSSSQNGLNRQTGANGSVSYNTYNIGAYQLTVTDVFYYDTPAQNQLDPSGETRYEAYVGFQPFDGMTASFNYTEYTYNATTRTWNNTNNSYTPVTGDTLSVEGVDYTYDGTAWVATPVTGDTLSVEGVDYTYDGTDWVATHTPASGDTLTVSGKTYQYNAETDKWTNQDDPSETYTPMTGDTLSVDGVDYTYNMTNWTASYAPAAGTTVSVNGMDYTYDGTKWTTTHTPASGDTFGHDGTDYIYDGTNWVATYAPAAEDTFSHDETVYIYDGTDWVATHAPVAGDTLSHDGTVYIYDGTEDWVATYAPAAGDTLSHDRTFYIYDGTAWVATHTPASGDTLTVDGMDYTYDGKAWVVTYTPVNNDTLTVNGVTYTYDGNAWKDSAGNEYTLQIGAQIDGTDYVYNGENWVETYVHENGDRINVDGKLYTYSSFYGSWRSSAGDEYTPEAGDRIVGTAYVYDADISAWVNTHLPADGNMIYSSGSIFTYNAMTGTWNNVAAVYTPVAGDMWIVESVTYIYDGTHWIDTGKTQDPVPGDIITTADGTTYKLGIDDKLVENLPYRYYTASGEYYVRPIINTTDDTINPYDGSLSLREAILLAGENLTINYTLDPAIYGENPDAPVISEKFHFGTEIVLSEKIAAGGSLEFIIGESNVYGTAADGTSLTSSFYDSIGINKGLTDSFGNDISYRIIAGTVDPTSYNVTLPASSLLPFEYDATDDATFQSLNLTLKVSDTVNGETGRFRVFDVISGDITLYGEGAGSLTILGGNVSNDNNPNRPASERTDESISNFGGAIRLSGADATLTLNGVTINRGIANRGGAIYVADGTLNLIGTTTINGTVAHGFASAGDNVSQVTYGDGYVYTSGYGAGIYMAGGSLVIGMDALSAEKAGEAFYASKVTISGGTAAQYGGGIYLAGDSSLLGNHSLYAYDAENRLYAPVSESFAISGNSAVSGAGLYIATTGSVSLERATISGNTLRQGVSSNFKVPTSGIPASYGGGLYVAAGSSVSLKGVTVTGNVTAEYKTPGQGSNPDVPNYVVSYGGGIYAEGTVTISESNLFLSGGDAPAQDIANSSISSNTALRGGGVYLADGGKFTMSGADPGKGGDVASVSGNTAISGSYRNETSNTTGQGGGLYVSAGATANLSNVVLSGNIANSVSSGAAADNNLSGRGGAVYTAGVFSLTNTTPSSETLRISMNKNSAAYGGAVYQAGGTVSLSYLSMYGNKASGVTGDSTSTGGALYLANGTANILNATIAGNIGDAAIYTGAGTLTLTNTTLALNTESNWGLVNSAATVFLRNTLVIGNGNSGYSNININDNSEYTNDGYSLVGTEENGYSVELIFGTNDFDPATGVIQLNTDQTAENPALTGGYLYRDSAGNAYDQLGNDRTETPGDGVYTIGAAIAGSVSPTTSVLVNTFTDDTTSDNDLYSLREAIQDAAGGNITIAFDLEALQNEKADGAEASFILDELLSWTAGTVTIDGSSLLASLETVSITAGTGNTDGLFALAETSGLVLSNFTVSGRAGASFGNDGAALSLARSSTATLTNVTVQNVVTSGNGAVSVANGASLTLAGNTVFASNLAKNGGALYNAGSLTVSGTLEFTGNQATENGGAIYNAAGTLTVTDAVFSGNTAAGNGGAIYNAAGTLTVTGDFTSNQAENGGAIYNAAGTLTVSDSAVLQGNIATGSGGAIYNAADGTLIAMSAQFSGNHADSGSGGAIYNAGSLTVSGTEFLANESKDGGAIYNEGVLQFTEGTNTVFAGNTATGNGGALYNASSDLQLARIL